jgi:hypothetical protein
VIPLTVREAPQGATWGAEVLQLPGLELLRASLDRRLPDPPVTKLTGLRLSEVGLGMASAWMPASPWWQSAAEVFLAGTTPSSRIWRSALPCSPVRQRGWG